MHGIKKNNLSIRLTESAVFLRTDDASGRNPNSDSRPSVLRGLLILELARPTKITSIDLKLQATSSTAWPEGFGSRRVDVTEDNKVFSVSTVLFNAGPPPRRTMSVGPGLTGYKDQAFDEYDDDYLDPASHSEDALYMAVTANANRYLRAQRRVSVDSSYRRNPQSYDADIPPYSLYAPSSSSGSLTTPSHSSPSVERPTLSPAHSAGHLETVDENPANTLIGLRNTLRPDLSRGRGSPSRALPPNPPTIHSSSSSLRSWQPISRDGSRSRRVSIDEPFESGPSTTQNSPQLSPLRVPSLLDTRSPSESRGRRKVSRFSLASVSNAIMDVVRSTSPRKGFGVGSRSTERDFPLDETSYRGRTREKAKPLLTANDNNVERSHSRQKGWSTERLTLGLLGDILNPDMDDKIDTERWREFKAGTYTYPVSFTIPGNAPPTLQCSFGSVSWTISANVHRPGTFKTKLSAQREIVVVSCPTEEDTEDTENIIVERHWDQQLQYLITISGRSFYIGGTIPISFTMMPLTKVKIHRLSVFIEEKVEYLVHFKRVARTEPITHVQLLSIKHEGKHPGPILPLESDDIDALRNSPLHAVVNSEDDISELASSWMGPGPWTLQRDLPLPSSCRMLHFTNKNKKSNICVTHTLKCVIRVETGDPNAVDPKTGRRKLFDIVVQTPIMILSCRCNPEWSSLPHYSKSFEDPTSIAVQCPCQLQSLERVRGKEKEREREHHPLPDFVGPFNGLERIGSGRSSDDSSASPVEASPLDPSSMRSLHQVEEAMDESTLYERLVSGQQSIMGEAPPAYDSISRRMTGQLYE
ncbi:uncharacterized protein BT62DRAFT_1002041 [Guyanagaster necrorhizus]|uniref:Arrestin C-terminal-like domain-containing protein n=1 Tax=Guyanagaster necrorhizus TaxID=856835 RepID=A0A9P7W015_9AGAR|nr:uncharacterized protein BT62DRAFT_1002041 [Guyanagaster necrorhizus MCA 3950]KAG7449723.1 hypothetical protein BT62DRAFT_1002041 [Guyanagaster necrorhizus MCA 3950]